MANTIVRSFAINGEMLRSIIKIRNHTQKSLSKKLGIGINTVYRAIKFNRMESKKDFVRICFELNIDSSLLLNDNLYFHPGIIENGSVTKVVEPIKITPDNVIKYIDLYPCDYNAEVILESSFDKNDFFLDHPFYNLLSESDKMMLYTHVLKNREALLRLFFDSPDDINKNDYIKNNLIKELKKNGYK